MTPLFVSMFILHLYPFIHPPKGSLILSRSLLSFCFALSHPSPFFFYAFSSFSCSSLQYTVPGGDSSKSNCLSISHQCTASRGSCPLKTMKVGLSAEPGIRFNYINKDLCFKKKEINCKNIHWNILRCTIIKILLTIQLLNLNPSRNRSLCVQRPLCGSIFLGNLVAPVHCRIIP